MKQITVFTILIVGLTFLGCGASKNASKKFKTTISPVKNFKVESYMGHWYEVARLDFKFQKGLDNCAAFYSLNENGSVKVINSGFRDEKNKWEYAKGKAKFRGEKNLGELKVSFFGPFYSDYNVVAIADNYKYALVFGKNLDYMWILSRTKQIPDSIREDFTNIARNAGYDVSNLLWANHDKNDNPYKDGNIK